MKARKLVGLASGGVMIVCGEARGVYTGLAAVYERHDGAGHDIYRVYAEFTNPTEGVVICHGNSANPLHIQTRNADDSGLGTNFYNPGGAGGSGPPDTPEEANGTYVTIGVDQEIIFLGSSSPISFSPGFPNFIAGTNNFMNGNIGWWTTGVQPWGMGGFVNIGNDTDTRVLIMQLAVATNERVRGTLNIGVVDGVNDGQLIFGQTFYGVPSAGSGALMAMAGAVLRKRRRRECVGISVR